MTTFRIYFILLPVLFFGSALSLFAQKNIYGIVTNEQDELLIGASVFWKDRSAGTTTDANGAFHIPARTHPDSLMVQYVGYPLVSVSVLPEEDSIWVVVEGSSMLNTVEITDHTFGNSVSTLSVRNIERINQQELRKAPCCNLSESFETNGTVDVAFPNALTGVKEIQMLGLRGIYSQFTLENRPAMTGLATPFAFEMIPGTWLEGISLAKGASSVINGNAGISGQINAELVKPLTDKPLFVNIFTSTEGRAEANIHLNRKRDEHRGDGLLLHGSIVRNQWDRNNDQFYDMPNRSQLNALYRHFYQSKKTCYQWNVQAVSDRRTSGQMALFPGQERLFAIQQNNDRVEAWGKWGIENIGGTAFRQIGNIFALTWHRTNAHFGPNLWKGQQQSLYYQTLYQDIIGSTDHQYVIAPSLQADLIEESVNNTVFDRKEWAPGIMGEYTWSHHQPDEEAPAWVVVAGARVDWNSRFRRWLFAPRMSAKRHLTRQTVARISAGRGFRSPHYIAENSSWLASYRTWIQRPDNAPESAWNYGINLTREFKWKGRKGNIALDLYRTDFTHQVLVDVDRSPLEVHIYSAGGPSWSQIAMIMAQYSFFKGFDAKMNFKWQDVQAVYSDGVRRFAPLTPRYRGLLTLDYTTPNKKWMFNLRSQLIGPQRIPDNSQVPQHHTEGFDEYSPVYSLWAGQATWQISERNELYLGGENLTGFQQHAAIISWDNPESPYFNGAQLWAPMGGRVIYAGWRMSLK